MKKIPQCQKNNILNIRIAEQEKQQYISEAQALNMNLSQYVLYLLRHKEIKYIEGGMELAKALYQINQNLNEIAKCNPASAQKLRTAATQGIETIMACVEKKK